MTGLADKMDEEAARMKRDFERRGVRVVEGGASDANIDGSTRIAVVPAPKKGNNGSVGRSRPRRRPVRGQNKFRAFYHHLFDSGLYINAGRDLDFGVEREIPLDDAGDCKIVLAKESYNSVLTFTILTSLLQNTSMLAYGPPGSGKTTAAEFVISGVYNVPLSAVQEATILGNPELTEEKMLAYIKLSSFIKKKEEIGVRKFMTTPGRLIDEANRMPPSKSSLLLNILDRGWAQYNDKKIRATPGPLFATVNGHDAGNYDMTPAFLDRFDIGVVSPELNPAFIEFYAGRRNNKIKFLEDAIVEAPEKITGKDIINARKEIYSRVSFGTNLMNRLAHFLMELQSCDKAGMTHETKTKGNALYKPPGPLCKDCRYFGNDLSLCHTTENSLSARTISTVYAYTKALSWWRGSNSVTEEDVKYVLAAASWFKLRPTRSVFEKEEGFTNDRRAFVYHLWETSAQSYEEICTVFPEYARIVRVVSDYHTGKNIPTKKELEDMMSSIRKIDSPARFPLATALKEMYQDHDRVK
jgi:MoxR-like ATPase